jgi:DNA-binding MarR family transcriptional regulator
MYLYMGTSDNRVLFDPIALERVITLMRSVEELTLPLALTLLAVAREPGLSVNQLAERIGAPQQTASRYAAILQGRYESSGAALNLADAPLLVLEVSADDPRKRALFLTRQGQKRLASILRFATETVP